MTCLLLQLQLHVHHLTALRVIQRNLRLQLLQNHLFLILSHLQSASIGDLDGVLVMMGREGRREL
jgi:hypothetical protein